MPRRSVPVALAVILALLLIGAAATDIYRSTRYTCLECRAVREECSIVHIPIAWTEYDDSARALLAAHPHHLHRWCYCGSTKTNSLLSARVGCGRQHPIWLLGPEEQLQHYRLVSPTEYAATLRDIDSPDSRQGQKVVYAVYNRLNGFADK